MEDNVLLFDQPAILNTHIQVLAYFNYSLHTVTANIQLVLKVKAVVLKLKAKHYHSSHYLT